MRIVDIRHHDEDEKVTELPYIEHASKLSPKSYLPGTASTPQCYADVLDECIVHNIRRCSLKRPIVTAVSRQCGNSVGPQLFDASKAWASALKGDRCVLQRPALPIAARCPTWADPPRSITGWRASPATNGGRPRRCTGRSQSPSGSAGEPPPHARIDTDAILPTRVGNVSIRSCPPRLPSSLHYRCRVCARPPNETENVARVKNCRFSRE